MELNEMEKIMYHMQELGLQVNECKNQGITEISIKSYEELLEYCINVLRIHEGLQNKIEYLKELYSYMDKVISKKC